MRVEGNGTLFAVHVPRLAAPLRALTRVMWYACGPWRHHPVFPTRAGRHAASMTRDVGGVVRHELHTPGPVQCNRVRMCAVRVLGKTLFSGKQGGPSPLRVRSVLGSLW